MCIWATGRHTGMTIHAGSHFWYHRQRQRQRQTETFCKRPGFSEWWLPVSYQTLPCYTLAIKAVVRKEQTVCDDQWIHSILLSAVLVFRLDSTADIPIVSMSARFLDQCLCLQYFIARSESYSLCCSCFQAWWFRSAVLASAAVPACALWLQHVIARTECCSLCCSCFQAWWFRSAVLASAELLRFLLAQDVARRQIVFYG